MRKLTLAAAALLAVSTVAASAQSGVAPGQDTHRGPAQEGGRTQSTGGASGSGIINPADPAAKPNVQSGAATGANTQAGPAQQGGRTSATPGYSGTTGDTMGTTGSVAPRSGSGVAPGQDTHKGPAQEGGRSGATPGATR